LSRQWQNWLSAGISIGLLIGLAAILGVLSGRRSEDIVWKRPSTFFTDPSGARALLLVMQKFLPSAEQWRRPLNLLPLNSDKHAPATLIVAGPKRPIAQSEAEHLDQWLAAGGQLILATRDGWVISSRLSEYDDDEDSRRSDQEGVGRLTYLSRHLHGLRWTDAAKEANSEEITGPGVPSGKLRIQSRQKFSSTGGAKIVASTAEAPLAIEIPVKLGRIVAIADPTIVSNHALRRADNAVWLVLLAAAWGNGSVLVDEFHHGFGKTRSTGELTWAFLQTSWGWCVLQLAAGGLLYLFVYRRRFGSIADLPDPSRASPLELIEARAGFFQAARAKALAVELMVHNLSEELANTYGKSVDLAFVSRKPESSGQPGVPANLIGRLSDLSAKSARGEKLTDLEFVEVGRITGQIVQGTLR
jgi:hypothetical protein